MLFADEADALGVALLLAAGVGAEEALAAALVAFGEAGGELVADAETEAVLLGEVPFESDDVGVCCGRGGRAGGRVSDRGA